MESGPPAPNEASTPIRRVVFAADQTPSGSPAETPSRGEVLLNRMGHVLKNAWAFRRPVTDFALHAGANVILGMGPKELAKSIAIWSGVGAAFGGAAGTIATGAFVGAIGGALTEYARQIGGNLDRKAEADPSLDGRKAKFLLKFKGLGDKETFRATNLKKIRNAAIFGAIAGAGAGALMEHTAIGGLIKERIEVLGLKISFPSEIPVVEGVKNLIGLGGIHETGQAAAENAGQGAAQAAAENAGQIVPPPDTDQIDPQKPDGVQDKFPAAPAAPAVAPQPAAPAFPDGAPSATAPTTAEPISPTTTPTGAEASGSITDNSLTYDNKPWVLLENGTKNIGQALQTIGETGVPVDQQVLASKLQEATNLWANGQLDPSTNPDLYRLFHLSNGTESIYKNLLNQDTINSLLKLGIIEGK